jgi:hypothetical protein
MKILEMPTAALLLSRVYAIKVYALAARAHATTKYELIGHLILSVCRTSFEEPGPR